jgi:cytochrome c biogenesis protein CcmG, thiol:disulfide interchange protein DsbE
MRLARTIAAILMACISSALVIGVVRAAPAMDEAAPPLVLTGIDGQTFDLAKLRGKVVLVNYWATWCDLAKVHKVVKTISYPAALAGEITNNGFGTPEGVPVTYVIDADGVVRDMFIAVPNKLLHDVVIPLLPH